MKSTWKRLASGILASCMATSMVAFAADTSEVSNINLAPNEKTAIGAPDLAFSVVDIPSSVSFDETVSLDSDNWEVTVLDENSYAQSLIDNLDMSPEDAAAEAHKCFSELAASNSTQTASLDGAVVQRADAQYVQFQSYVYPTTAWANKGWGVRYGFTAIMTTGSTPLFKSISAKWAKACGSGPHTYSGDSLSAMVVDTTHAKIAGGGDVLIKMNGSVSASGGYSQSTIKGWGFSVTTTISGTLYYRKYVSFNKTFRPAWAN